MQSARRRHRHGLIGRLLGAPHRFEFFQAVRVLRRHLRRQRRSPSGEVGESIRFRNSLSLAFPASEIETLEAERAAGASELSRVTLTPSFLGLTGNLGALPQHYTERLAERESLHRDGSARAFLDIFANRTAAQFFGAWEKYRLHFQHEADERERYLPLLLSLMGAESASLRGRLGESGNSAVFDETLAYYAGMLRNGPRSEQSVSAVLSDYFRVPIKVRQFVGQWFRLPAHSQAALGVGAVTLGADSICGERIWQRDGRIGIEIGPLARDVFLGFMPGGASARALDRLLSLVVGPTIEIEVRISLRRQDVAPLSLADDCAGRLGWDTWTASRPFSRDPDDATYCFIPGFIREVQTQTVNPA